MAETDGLTGSELAIADEIVRRHGPWFFPFVSLAAPRLPPPAAGASLRRLRSLRVRP